MSRIVDQQITSLEQLEKFTCAVIRAHGDMITTDEAIDGIRVAFQEYVRLKVGRHKANYEGTK